MYTRFQVQPETLRVDQNRFVIFKARKNTLSLLLTSTANSTFYFQLKYSNKTQTEKHISMIT